MKSRFLKSVFIISLAVALSGCTFIFQKGRRSDVQKIEELTQSLDELTSAKRMLEDQLAQEIKDKQVRLQMMEKGLVITFVADILFDSGKATIKPESHTSLDKVASVLNETVPNLSVGIEGHTDDQPIKLSGWRSNWELSAARALSVLHYLENQGQVSPSRLKAEAFGEFHPVAANDTKDGRQLNRRVEIVILPQVQKVKKSEQANIEPQGNLK